MRTIVFGLVLLVTAQLLLSCGDQAVSNNSKPPINLANANSNSQMNTSNTAPDTVPPTSTGARPEMSREKKVSANATPQTMSNTANQNTIVKTPTP